MELFAYYAQRVANTAMEIAKLQQCSNVAPTSMTKEYNKLLREYSIMRWCANENNIHSSPRMIQESKKIFSESYEAANGILDIVSILDGGM